MTTRFCFQRISLRDLLAYSVGRSSVSSRHSDKTCKMVSSCSPQKRLGFGSQPELESEKASRSSWGWGGPRRVTLLS
ncbi:hypothetical protein PoB_006868600 [Plakobranchus ocellatus]|uniref:Uncharacterized protein n=1 Tax=Plakobranchus ocellatus TaxID=259542 RepID=A0AAV4DEB0_9GAST|nr:hypothetical protein PoB_006868600 [Plakobranchus ocellatus]